MKNKIILIKLGIEDVEQYQNLRLISFQESPFAFSESYEDECKRSVEDFSKEVIGEA